MLDSVNEFVPGDVSEFTVPTEITIKNVDGTIIWNTRLNNTQTDAQVIQVSSIQNKYDLYYITITFIATNT